VVDRSLVRLLVVVAALVAGVVQAQEWTLDVLTGTSVHAPNDLVVFQEGYGAVTIQDARYRTNAWVNASSLLGLTENYYAVRVGHFPSAARLGRVDVGYELELLHDKAYYQGGVDPDGIVERFELSDGLNQLLANVVVRYPLLGDEGMPDGRLHLLARAGVGPAITAPASVVRGLEDGTRTHLGTEGYYWLAGPGLQVAGQARWYLTRFLATSVEVKGTLAHTVNPVADGWARAAFAGLHVDLGLTLHLR
jgi:hypothetical protein